MEITDEILNIMSEIKPYITDDPNINLIEDGFFDSLDLVNLVALLDMHFQIEIDVKDIIPENFENVDSVVKLVTHLMSSS